MHDEVQIFYFCVSPKREMDHYSTDADVAHVPQAIRHLRPTPWLRGRNGKEVEEGASEKKFAAKREKFRVQFTSGTEVIFVLLSDLLCDKTLRFCVTFLFV